MRQLRFQPKVAKRVTIPKQLKDFFGYTRSLIEAGDSAAVRASDDLIQQSRAYGGLVEEGGDLYAFTYFPGSHTRPRWDIEATSTEIADMAAGKVKHLSLWGCTNPVCEDLFSSPEDVCMYCDYVDDERDARDRVMPQLLNSSSREEWVRGYIKHFPNDHPMLIIGKYNSQPNLGERLGWFTMQEMDRIVAEAKSSPGGT